MAEPKNTQYPIPLQGQLLNTSGYEYDTKQFIGFNKLEGSFYQGCLSPFYYNNNESASNVLFVDSNNNKWSYDTNGNILKNGTTVAAFPTIADSFPVEKVEKEDPNIVAVLPNGIYVYYDGSKVSIKDADDNLKFEVNKTFDDFECHFCVRNGVYYILFGSSFVIECPETAPENSRVLINLIEEKYVPFKYITTVVQQGTSSNYYVVINYRNEDNNDGMYCFKVEAGTTYSSIEGHFLSFKQFQFQKLGYYHELSSYVAICNDVIYFKEDTTLFYKTEYDIPYAWRNPTITPKDDGTFELYTIVSSDIKVKGPSEGSREALGRVKFNVKDLLKTENVVFQTLEVNASEYLILPGTGKNFSTIISFDTKLKKASNYNVRYEFLINENNAVAGFQVANEGNIRLFGSRNNAFGISFKPYTVYSHQGTLIEPWQTINENKPIYIDGSNVFYFTENTAKYTKHGSAYKYKQFLGRYIVRNNAFGENCYDTKTGKFLILGTDAGNSFLTDIRTDHLDFSYDENTRGVINNTSFTTKKDFTHWAQISVNEQYTISNINVSGATFNAIQVRSPIAMAENNNMLRYVATEQMYGTGVYSTGEGQKLVNLYVSESSDKSATPNYNCSYDFNKRNNSDLTGTTYPNDATNNYLLNVVPSIDEIETSYLMYTSFKLTDNLYAQLATIGGSNLLNYYAGTISYDSPAIFTIAGQMYTIKEQTIYYSSETNGVLSTIQPILNVGKMKFLGTLPLAALFYSSANKKIYAFTGDTNLTELLDISRYGDPKVIKANTTTQDIILMYEEMSIIINDNGIYEVPIAADKVFFTENSMLFYKNGTTTINEVAYYKVDNNFKPLPLKIKTCFYGLQNNIVSTNDCIYLRLYNPNNEDGYLKLKATTLMNDLKETETKEITISKDMFDKDSKTFYFRFQPALQKATSESLEIDTPFSVGSIIFSNQPETTLIGSQGNGSKPGHNF